MIYIGVGGSGEMSLRNAESAKRVLNSTFLVQEYVEGGNLRNQVLEQVTPLPLLQCFSDNVMERRMHMSSSGAFWASTAPIQGCSTASIPRLTVPGGLGRAREIPFSPSW